MSEPDPARVLAFFLPQYHPVPENDTWWGKGFTEWSNVVRGRPLFNGHYQPHLPADLGFYDLRVPEVREQQAQLAAAVGLSGFVYYHYWFGGQRLLNRPFDEILASGAPDFPFALCWANENWTRRWDGGSQEILIGQRHGDSDDRDHLDAITPALLDSRYIRVDGKPVFLVYRAALLPDARRTTDLWRKQAQQNGVGELFLVKVEAFPEDAGPPDTGGFDATVGWEPAWGTFGPPLRRRRYQRWARRLRLTEWAYRDNAIYQYDALVSAAVSREAARYPRFPCVTPMWDNSVRRTHGGAVVLKDSTPDAYGRWLTSALQAAQVDPLLAEPLVFINAWNEWAEGNHLEPDQRWGRAYLDATARAITTANTEG